LLIAFVTSVVELHVTHCVFDFRFLLGRASAANLAMTLCSEATCKRTGKAFVFIRSSSIMSSEHIDIVVFDLSVMIVVLMSSKISDRWMFSAAALLVLDGLVTERFYPHPTTPTERRAPEFIEQANSSFGP